MSEAGEIVVKPIGITPEGRLVPTDSGQIGNYAKLVWNSEARPRWAKSATDLIIAMNFGREAGLTLTQSVSKVYVVNGAPKMHSGAPMAVVMASGLLRDRKITWNKEGTSCTVWMKRGFRDSAIEVENEWTFTLDDAKRAGLAGKGPWLSFPRNMLYARACNTCIEQLFPDLLAGLVTDGMDSDVPMTVTAVADATPTVDAAVTRLEQKLGLQVGSGETEPASDAASTSDSPAEQDADAGGTPDQPASGLNDDQRGFLESMGDSAKPTPTSAERFAAAKKKATGK